MHTPSQYLVATAQGREGGTSLRPGCTVWGSPQNPTFQGLFPPSIKRSSSNRKHPIKTTGEGEGKPETHSLQTLKCYVNTRHWFHTEISLQTWVLRLPGVSTKVCVMILSRPLTLCWNCSRTKNYLKQKMGPKCGTIWFSLCCHVSASEGITSGTSLGPQTNNSEKWSSPHPREESDPDPEP